MHLIGRCILLYYFKGKSKYLLYQFAIKPLYGLYTIGIAFL